VRRGGPQIQPGVAIDRRAHARHGDGGGRAVRRPTPAAAPGERTCSSRSPPRIGEDPASPTSAERPKAIRGNPRAGGLPVREPGPDPPPGILHGDPYRWPRPWLTVLLVRRGRPALRRRARRAPPSVLRVGGERSPRRSLPLSRRERHLACRGPRP